MPGPLGLGLPNRQWEAWGPHELELAAELGPSALVVLVYGDQPEEVRQAQAAAARALAARTGARLLLRAYEPNVPQWVPTDWAGECARRAGLFTGERVKGKGERESGSLSPFPWPLSPVEMIPGNELNLECEGGSLAWAIERGPSWLLNVAKRYRRLRRGERLHLPAPSPGEGGAEAVAFWEACARAGVGRRYDVVDVHAYSDEQVRTLPRLARELFGRPVALTEWNQADPALVAAEVRANPWLEGACYFILAGALDQRRYWLVEQPDVLHAFRRAQDP